MPAHIPILAGFVDTYIEGAELGAARCAPWVTHQAAFVRRSICAQYPFDTDLRVFGDLDFWMRLKADDLFLRHDVDLCVARMCMDGVGTHPKFWWRRIRDKHQLCKKHGGGAVLPVLFVVGSIGWLVYQLCGERFYHLRFLELISSVKKFIRSF